MTPPGDITTNHADLARADGILDEVSRLRRESPDEVDAGMIVVINQPEGGILTVDHVSSTLDFHRVIQMREHVQAKSLDD